MDMVLNFFTETLSGWTYVVTTIISIIIILGIIGFLSERKFNLENNLILTKNYNNEEEDEIILGDQTLYDKKEEVAVDSNIIPQMSQNPNVKVDNNVKKEDIHKEEVI